MLINNYRKLIVISLKIAEVNVKIQTTSNFTSVAVKTEIHIRNESKKTARCVG